MHLQMESNGMTMAWDLDRCPRQHPRDWWTCTPKVVACHHGPLHEMPEHAAGYNRVLAAVPFFSGTTLLRQVDLADVDSSYRRGANVVTLMTNAVVFRDKTGPRGVFVVSVANTNDADIYVAVFDDLDAAWTEFDSQIEP